jgi:hypothetical protein
MTRCPGAENGNFSFGESMGASPDEEVDAVSNAMMRL